MTYELHAPAQRRLRSDQYETCYCCQRVYEKKYCTRLDYECKVHDHIYTFCINCCYQHENCPVDTTEMTNAASSRMDSIDKQLDQPGSGQPEPFDLA